MLSSASRTRNTTSSKVKHMTKLARSNITNAPSNQNTSISENKHPIFDATKPQTDNPPLPHKHRSIKSCFPKPMHFSFKIHASFQISLLTWNGHSLAKPSPSQHKTTTQATYLEWLSLCQTKSKTTTHAPSEKTSRVTMAIGDRPGHKQLPGTPTPISLHCCGATTPCGRQPPPWELSPQFIIVSVHGVCSSDVTLVSEHLWILIPAPASTDTKSSPFLSPDPYSTLSQNP